MLGSLSNTTCKLLGVLLLAFLLGGCMTVKSTSIYYIPSTTKVYPPKPPDAPIPILGKMPPEPYSVIGKFAFKASRGWEFFRKSMIYNAQMNGADAVVLKDASTTTQSFASYIPPQTRFQPTTIVTRNSKNGHVSTSTILIPYFQPGYVQQWMTEITAIDADMIVFKK